MDQQARPKTWEITLTVSFEPDEVVIEFDREITEKVELALFDAVRRAYGEGFETVGWVSRLSFRGEMVEDSLP